MSMAKCTICCFEVASTWKCSCCPNMVCIDCMPRDSSCCFECQNDFPVSPSSHIPVQAFSVRDPKQLRTDLYQSSNIADQRISLFDALATSLHHVAVWQSKNESITQNAKSFFEVEADTSIAVEARTRHKKILEASQDVCRLKENVNSSLKPKSCNAAPRTLMICNLPCRIGYDELVEAIDSIGFGDAFEFVHLASRYKQPDSNLGYAFVNFFSPKDAARFARAFEGYHFDNKGSKKACTVKVAKSQGFNGSYRRKQRNLQQHAAQFR